MQSQWIKQLFESLQIQQQLLFISHFKDPEQKGVYATKNKQTKTKNTLFSMRKTLFFQFERFFFFFFEFAKNM